MAGTDSTYIGMPGMSGSTSVNKGLRDTQRGNQSGDVVDNSASDNPLNDGTLRNDPAAARGAYLDQQAKAPNISA